MRWWIEWTYGFVSALALNGFALAADEPVWDRTKPDSAIYLPKGDDDGCNQQVVGIVTQQGSLLVTWTMASKEAKPDQRVVVARSCDRGKTWSRPAVLDQNEKGNPGLATYGVLFEVPTTGRIYLFYLKNEPSWLELSDGRLVTAFRTRNGAVYYAVSPDGGETWTKPEPLLNHEQGEPLKNPSAPCPMLRMKDGRIILLFYNQTPDSTFGPRNPAYLVIGREALESNQPIEFGEPVKLMEVTGVPQRGTTYVQVASYSSLVEHKGQVLLFYNDCKHWVLFKVIPEDLLKPRFPRQRH